MKRCLNILTIFFFLICFSGVAMALTLPNLPRDPDWLFNEEISKAIPGWDRGYVKCEAPKGGYNKIVDNQKIIDSWGYKAKPIEEIKDLLPEPIYNIISHPEVWGTFRINETLYEDAAPRGPMWEKWMKASKRNIKQVTLSKKGWLSNYENGVPFPVIDTKNDPQAGLKIIWNFHKRFQGDDRFVRMNFTTRNRRGSVKHHLLLNQRLRMNGRNHSEDPVYKPNPQNYDYLYAIQYLEPYQLRGTFPLFYRYNDPDKGDDMWIYIPSIRRVRRMSTAQHQDRIPGGMDWTWDNGEGFEGNVTHFNWSYIGRKVLLTPALAYSQPTWNQSKTGHLGGMDQYYQRRNCYIIKASYKTPINMTDLILYIDPELYCCCWSYDLDLKGRIWIVQGINNGRDKDWYYTMYNDWAFDVLVGHTTNALFAYSGNNEGFTPEYVTIQNYKRMYLAR